MCLTNFIFLWLFLLHLRRRNRCLLEQETCIWTCYSERCVHLILCVHAWLKRYFSQVQFLQNNIAVLSFRYSQLNRGPWIAHTRHELVEISYLDTRFAVQVIINCLPLKIDDMEGQKNVISELKMSMLLNQNKVPMHKIHRNALISTDYVIYASCTAT